jgi:hypothetical protein
MVAETTRHRKKKPGHFDNLIILVHGPKLGLFEGHGLIIQIRSSIMDNIHTRHHVMIKFQISNEGSQCLPNFCVGCEK